MNKTNAQHLRKIVQELTSGDVGEKRRGELFTEADEFIDSIEEEVASLKEELHEQEEKVSELQDELEGVDERPYCQTIELGNDTLNYYFDKGNLELESKFESMIKRLIQTPYAEI